MGIFAEMTLIEWIVLFILLAAGGGACWLVHDSRRRGIPVGGKFCCGRPLDRNNDGSYKEAATPPETVALQKTAACASVPEDSGR